MVNLSPTSLANQAQQRASNPFVSAWVSASAGSGKTKVLTDRVLNLLLAGNNPEKILCLTFTKTAAAEMSNRLSEILRDWTVISQEDLSQKLQALTGKEASPEIIAMARTLFARLLDVKGGMKIMTIHSFCQSLLKRFPLEANLSPAFDVMDDKEARFLLGQAIRQTTSDSNYAQSLHIISDYMDEKSFTDLMQTLDMERNRLKRLLESQMGLQGLTAKIYDTLNVSVDLTATDLIKSIYEGDDFEGYKAELLTQKEEIRAQVLKDDILRKKAEALLEVLDKIKALRTAQATAAFLKLGFGVLQRYEELKGSKGLLDYDDLILKTRQLLEESNMAAWVLFKLDGGIDHILVDEAQDTSPDQWAIIRLIAEEFFAGMGRSEKIRTIFAVGDAKQSIYSFQGADPAEFERMRSFFEEHVKASENVFENVPLNISFRSTKAVLDLVNYLLKNKQATNGVLLSNEDATHLAFRDKEAGLVEIWPIEPYLKKEKNETPWMLPFVEENEKSASVRLAEKIANRIHQMLQNKEILASQNRPIRAGDIMILVRRRNQFIHDLVRALKEKQIPVAGVDRIVLNTHIAVQDLISLGEFLLLPEDDLKLAEILKSPLFGLSEEALFDLSYHRGVQTIWSQLHRKQPEVYEKLRHLLALTDTMPPFELYAYVLSSLNGREDFVKRLGKEANEALDEFLNLALLFEQNNTASLQGFLKWLKADEIEIKRDMEQNELNAVRIMTIHGSKGLQSNIVFLPDTCKKPNKTPSLIWMNGIPIWLPRKEVKTKQCTPILNALQNLQEQEYNRLLYVAITRAKDRLYIAGYETGQKSAPGNWYELIAASVPGYTPESITTLVCEQKKEVPFIEKNKTSDAVVSLPDCFYTLPPEEPMPSKPLTPSKMKNEEPGLSSPITPEQEKAMRRGTFIHKALQILPEIEKEKRIEVINALKPDDIELPDNIYTLLDNPDFAHLFSKDSMAEVPLIGNIDGFIVSGQIDRLVMTETEVLIIDFKTNRLPPQTKNQIPKAYLEQMDAYKSLLKKLFKGKKVRGFLLWTTDLTLMEV